jgi:hypothetical protein
VFVGSHTSIVHERRMSLTAAEFKGMYDSRRKRGLAIGWTDIFYDKFHKVWPHCALSALDNRCRVANSRKGDCAPFWKGVFACRVSDECVKVIMTIADFPDGISEVPVDVTILGQCCHLNANETDDEAMDARRPNRRFLKGDNRRRTAELVTECGKSPAEIHYAALGTMSEIECQSLNTTPCQTPNIIRQAAHGRRVSEQLHSDMLLELDVQREAWNASMPGRIMCGYIQSISIVPFCVTFFTEGQIDSYIRYCKEDSSSTVHFDATGSVVKEITGQKRPLYYCMLMAQTSLPVFEFITTTHASFNIRSQLDFFNEKARQINAGRTVNPHYAVTDFSYALIDACLRSFNV